MSASPWVRFYPSDWLAGTRGMTAAETGIYMTLIMMMYERQEPIRDDRPRLARLCGASNAVFKRAIEQLVEDGKIIEREGGLWNERVEKELSYRREIATVAREKANSKWDKKRKENNDSPMPQHHGSSTPADASQSQNQKEYYAAPRVGSIDQRIGELYDALGVTDETKLPSLLTFSEPIRWVSAGCDIDADIIPALRSIAARGKTVKSWSYCSDAVFEARDRRLAPPPPVQRRNATAPPPKHERTIIDALDDIAAGKWPQSPEPNHDPEFPTIIDAGFSRRN